MIIVFLVTKLIQFCLGKSILSLHFLGQKTNANIIKESIICKPEDL